MSLTKKSVANDGCVKQDVAPGKRIVRWTLKMCLFVGADCVIRFLVVALIYALKRYSESHVGFER